MTKATALHGFIIASTDWDDTIKLEMGKGTLAMSAADAWRRHLGPDRSNSRDFPMYIQRCSDKGYKPFRVVLTIDDTPDPLERAAEILRRSK